MECFHQVQQTSGAIARENLNSITGAMCWGMDQVCKVVHRSCKDKEGDPRWKRRPDLLLNAYLFEQDQEPRIRTKCIHLRINFQTQY